MKKCKVFRNNSEGIEDEMNGWLNNDEEIVDNIIYMSQSSVGDVIVVIVIYECLEKIEGETDDGNGTTPEDPDFEEDQD